MTEEYKERLLDYITGDITPTEQTTAEIFKEENNIPRSWWNASNLPNAWNNFRYEGMVAPNELTSNLAVLYGGYLDTDNNSHGIITLVDGNFKPIKSIYEYSNGTPLRYIQYMKQAEDGTFYFIDDTVFTNTQWQEAMTSQKRFVMVNNFALINQVTNDYQVNLRTSYIFSATYQNFYCKNMFKDPNSAHYIFFGSGFDSNGYYPRLLKIIDLKVNVGEANEWTLLVSENLRNFGSAIALFDNDSNVEYRCLVTNNQSSSNDLMCYSKTFEGNPTSSVIITFNDYKPYIDDANYKKQSVFLNYDEVYFVQNNQRWGNTGSLTPKYIGLYKYNFTSSNLSTIYENYLGDYDFCNLSAIYIDRCNADLYIQFNDNVTTINNESYSDYYFQRLDNDIWNPILIGTQKYFGNRSIFVKNNFNLLSIFLYQTNPRSINYWFTYQIKENYNVLNYNGEDYTDYNSLVPKQGEVYSNGKLVFARNLYNKTLNDNTTISTIQIPNSYLNDVDLNLKNLISETNTTLINDTNVIQKNIYETLFLNYINTIDVLDEDTNTLYPEAGSYVNENINVGTQANCEDTFIGKIRVNYLDNTSNIFDIQWKKINKYNAVTYYSLYVDKGIKNIEYVSNDGYTTYCTKEPTLEIGNVYTISQKIRTGNKPKLVQLQFNNEDINYNSEPVMVYIEEV